MQNSGSVRKPAIKAVKIKKKKSSVITTQHPALVFIRKHPDSYLDAANYRFMETTIVLVSK
jgi:hypothetical protein